MRNRGGGEKGGMERERVEKVEGGGRWRDGDKEARECKREREVYLDRHCKTHLSMGREGGGGGGWISGAKTWAMPRSNDNLRFGERSTATKRLQSVSA